MSGERLLRQTARVRSRQAAQLLCVDSRAFLAGRRNMSLCSWNGRHCALLECRCCLSHRLSCACRQALWPCPCQAVALVGRAPSVIADLLRLRLTMQLVLVHGQIVSLLTATALSAMFARNPGYDARRLLGEPCLQQPAQVSYRPAALASRPSCPVLPCRWIGGHAIFPD